MTSAPAKRRILAISSGGGHWTQLLRLRPAFEGCDVHYATVDASCAAAVAPAPLYTYTDANKDTPFRLLLSALRILWIVLMVRPHVVVSTGAAGGYLAIRFGKLIGARTLFIDSIANARELSLSAKLSLGSADRVLTQWATVARSTGAVYRGAVL